MTSITRRGVEVPFRGGDVTATTFMDGYVVLAVTTHGASFSLHLTREESATLGHELLAASSEEAA